MTTSWTAPTNFSQYAEEGGESIHIPWNIGTRLGLAGVLTHIARSPKTDGTNKTYFIKAQGFNFNNLPEVISGVELKLKSDRRGRVTDDTVQLLINDQPVGDNLATLTLETEKTYGNETLLWGIDSIPVENLTTSSFGVLIRFQSHPHFPHRDGAYINGIELRIH